MTVGVVADVAVALQNKFPQLSGVDIYARVSSLTNIERLRADLLKLFPVCDAQAMVSLLSAESDGLVGHVMECINPLCDSEHLLTWLQSVAVLSDPDSRALNSKTIGMDDLLVLVLNDPSRLCHMFGSVVIDDKDEPLHHAQFQIIEDALGIDIDDWDLRICKLVQKTGALQAHAKPADILNNYQRMCTMLGVPRSSRLPLMSSALTVCHEGEVNVADGAVQIPESRLKGLLMNIPNAPAIEHIQDMRDLFRIVYGTCGYVLQTRSPVPKTGVPGPLFTDIVHGFPR